MSFIFKWPNFGRIGLNFDGKAGPEALISLDGSQRAKSLWTKAGEKLGMITDGSSAAPVTIQINAPFSPVVQGDVSGLAKERDKYLEGLRDIVRSEIDRNIGSQKRLGFR